MATKLTSSLYGSGRQYRPFVLEATDTGKLFAVAVTEDGIVRGEVKAVLPLTVEGLIVAQAAKNPDGGAHVQVKTEKPGNRAYGWAFDTDDPAIVAVAA